MTEPFYESSIEVTEAHKTLYVFNILGSFPFFYCFCFDWIHFDTLWTYHKSEVFCFFLMEFAFRWFEFYLCFLEFLQDFSDIFIMLFLGFCIYEDVIQIYYA